MTPVVYDVFPITENGETVYKEANLCALGAVTQQQFSTVNTTLSVATSALPNKPVSQVSDFTKVAGTIGSIAAIVAIVPGIGWVAAAVCGIVAGVCALLGKIFAQSKAKKYAAERYEYDKLNSQLRYENEQLDLHYAQGAVAIQDLRKAFGQLSGSAPLMLNGLGSQASRQKELLQNAKNEFELLTTAQNQKTKLLMGIVDEFNKLMKSKFELKQTQSLNQWLGWTLAGAAILMGGYYTYQNRNTIKKELSK